MISLILAPISLCLFLLSGLTWLLNVHHPELIGNPSIPARVFNAGVAVGEGILMVYLVWVCVAITG